MHSMTAHNRKYSNPKLSPLWPIPIRSFSASNYSDSGGDVDHYERYDVVGDDDSDEGDVVGR